MYGLSNWSCKIIIHPFTFNNDQLFQFGCSAVNAAKTICSSQVPFRLRVSFSDGEVQNYLFYTSTVFGARVKKKLFLREYQFLSKRQTLHPEYKSNPWTRFSARRQPTFVDLLVRPPWPETQVMSAQALELTARGKGRSGSSWIIGKLIAKQSSENIYKKRSFRPIFWFLSVYKSSKGHKIKLQCTWESMFILATFWRHSGYILAIFWLHTDNILTTFWLHSDNILTTFWLNSDYILTILWVYFGYNLTTSWLHSAYILQTDC